MDLETIDQLNLEFEHPSMPDFKVTAVMDYMFKLVQNALAKYKEFIWQGHGTIKWEPHQGATREICQGTLEFVKQRSECSHLVKGIGHAVFHHDG